MGCSGSRPEEEGAPRASDATPTKAAATGAPASAPAQPATPATPATSSPTITRQTSKPILKVGGSSPSPSMRESSGGRSISFETGMKYPEVLPGKAIVEAPIPYGFVAGDQLMLEMPDGRKQPITIPAGSKGKTFRAKVPLKRVGTDPLERHLPKRDSAPDESQASAPEPAPAAADDAAPAEAPAAPAEPAEPPFEPDTKVTAERKHGGPVAAVVKSFDAASNKYTLVTRPKGGGIGVEILIPRESVVLRGEEGAAPAVAPKAEEAPAPKEEEATSHI